MLDSNEQDEIFAVGVVVVLEVDPKPKRGGNDFTSDGATIDKEVVV